MRTNAAGRCSWQETSGGMKAACAGAALAVALAACGQGSGGSSNAGSGGFEIDVEHCAGFTAADAASVLGVDAASVEESSQPIGEDKMWCIFASSDDPSLSVNFTVGRAESTEAATEELAQFVSHVGVAQEVLGDEGVVAHMVPDLGDEAVWSPTPGILVVRSGPYSLQVNNPSDEETQVAIARRILSEK